MKADISTLDQAITKELDAWKNEDLKRAFNTGVEEAAKVAEKRLKQGGPYKKRTGKYSKDWTSGVRNTQNSAITGFKGYSVYNKKHYQLTHLLEKGHQSRNGRRVIPAFEHISPVNDAVGELAVANIKRNLGG